MSSACSVANTFLWANLDLGFVEELPLLREFPAEVVLGIAACWVSVSWCGSDSLCCNSSTLEGNRDDFERAPGNWTACLTKFFAVKRLSYPASCACPLPWYRVCFGSITGSISRILSYTLWRFSLLVSGLVIFLYVSAMTSSEATGFISPQSWVKMYFVSISIGNFSWSNFSNSSTRSGKSP